MRRVVWCILLVMLASAVVSQGVHVKRSARYPAAAAAVCVDGEDEPVVVVTRRDRAERRATTVWAVKPAKPAANDTAVTRQTRVEGDFLAKDVAWNDALDHARAWLTHELNLTHAVNREFFTRHGLVKAEEVKGPNVLGTDTVKFVMDVAVTRAAERELLDADRRSVAGERIDVAGRGMAVLTLLLGAVAGFVRLDDWTKGYYTKRIGALLGAVVLAATALIVAA